MNLVVVDYGMGNIQSVMGALRKASPASRVVYSHDMNDIRAADKLILPGVGNFGAAMYNLDRLGLTEELRLLALNSRIPILGICLGMQLLCDSSDEALGCPGLRLVSANLTQFDRSISGRIPHVGFNSVLCEDDSILLSGISEPDYYFTHSYCLVKSNNVKFGITHHGQSFVSLFERDNIFGVQFHPELSQTNGLKLLKNFIDHA